MAARIGFKVIHNSSYDAGHGANELESRSQKGGKGWQSARFCDYPQTLVAELHSMADIKQIQILSHQSKIASKVEIFVGKESTNKQWETINWKRLGYLSLDKNERSNWKARELKSVYIDAKGNYIKLAMHESHLNSINLFNQVGIVALNVLGSKVSSTQSNESSVSMSVGSTSIDESEFDSKTAAKIRELTNKKKKAVDSEDYDEAKKCKTAIDRLKKASSELIRLEKEKKKAVSEEDYDLAKHLKQKIEKLRVISMNPDAYLAMAEQRHSQPVPNHTYPPQHQQQADFPPHQPATHPSQFFNSLQPFQPPQQQPIFFPNGTHPPPNHGHPPVQSHAPPGPGLPGGHPPGPIHAPVERQNSLPAYGAPQQQSPMNQQPQYPPQQQPMSQTQPPVSRQASGMPPNMSRMNTDAAGPPQYEPSNSTPRGGSGNPDERAIRPMPSNKAIDAGSNPFGPKAIPPSAQQDANEHSIPPPNNSRSRRNSERPLQPTAKYSPPAMNDKHSPPAFNKDPFNGGGGGGMPGDGPPRDAAEQEGPEPLKPSVRKDNEHFIEIFGEYTVQCLYSKTWTYRDEGLKEIGEFVARKEHPDQRFVTKLACKAVHKALRDRVATVFLSGTDLLTRILENVGSDVSPEDIVKFTHGSANELVKTLGHSNARLVDSSGTMLITLAHHDHVVSRMVYSELIRPMKKKGQPKHLKGRGVVLLELMPQFKIPKGITLGAMMQNLIIDQLRNKNGDVRDIGVQLATFCYEETGTKIIPFLADCNDFLKETLNNSFEQATGRHNVLRRVPKSTKEQTRPSKAMARRPAPPPKRRGGRNPLPGNRGRRGGRGGAGRGGAGGGRGGKENQRGGKQRQKPGMRSPIKSPNPKSPQFHGGDDDEELEDMCNFCGLRDESFAENEENLDLHYWQSCPMLTSCKLCEQVIEIPTLNEHILTECEAAQNHSKCNKCSIPYDSNGMKSHVKAGKCKPMLRGRKGNRCPLCVADIPPGDDGWRSHLLTNPGCPQNDRQLPP